MKTISILTIVLILSLLSGCSDDKQKPAAQAPAANMPADKPANTSAGALPMSGKVLKAMHAGGYTYMEVDSNGKVFWVAATMLNVKRNDQIAWGDAAVMKNFKSPSLRRTFDEILFVSAAKVQ